MAITYTWKVTNLKKVDDIEGNPNVIVHARWTRTGTDEDGNTGDFQGATPLRLPPVSGSGEFTPFEEITEEQVIDWIKGEISGLPGYEDHIVSQITKQINAKKAPAVDVELLPWGVQAVGVAGTPAVASPTEQPNAAPRYYNG